MLLLPVLLLVVVGVAVVVASAGERPRLLPLLAAGAAGLVALLLVAAVVGLGLRGGEDEEGGSPSRVTAPVPAEPEPVEVREVDAVIRPHGRSDRLDRLPDVTTRLVRIRTDDRVVVRQCVEGGGCRPGIPMLPHEGSTLGLVELHRRVGGTDCAMARCRLVVTRPDSGGTVASVPLWFGRPAPVVPAAPPRPERPARPEVRPDLPTGRLVGGLAVAVSLLASAAWLLRRRPDEQVEDPFWDVALDVPEWEGIRVELHDDEFLSPAGGPPARRGR